MKKRAPIAASLAAALACVLPSCSEEGADPPREGPAPPAGGAAGEGSPRDRATAAADAPDEPRPIDPASLGSIRGLTLFEGETPRRRELEVAREPACDIHPTPPLTEFAVVNDGRLANVLVTIDDGWKRWELPPLPESGPVLDQVGCIYVPHVLTMRVGETLLVRNSDPTTHNVHMRARKNGDRNQSQPTGGAPLEFTLEKAELGIPFKCDIHPWMGAVVHVEEHPWCAVSDDEGSFVIADVPAGDYVLEARHEKFGRARAEVTVEAGAEAEATFTFRE